MKFFLFISFHLFLKLLRIHNCTGYWMFLMLFKFNYLCSFAKWELILAFMLLVQNWIFLYFSPLQSGWRKVKIKKNKKKNKIYMNQVKFASNCIHLFFFSLTSTLFIMWCNAMLNLFVIVFSLKNKIKNKKITGIKCNMFPLFFLILWIFITIWETQSGKQKTTLQYDLLSMYA